MAKERKTATPMLSWQYKQLLSFLGAIQAHASDWQCPCNQVDLGKDGKFNGEYCLGKHLMDLEFHCRETSLMDEPHKDLLEDMADEASEYLEKAKTIYCKGGTWPDLAQWSRNSRKKLEPIYYTCKLKLHDSEEAPLADTTTDKIDSQLFGIKLAAAEFGSACPEHSTEKSFTGIKKEIDKRSDTIENLVDKLMARPTSEKPCPPSAPCPQVTQTKQVTGPVNNTFAFGITTTERYVFQWKIIDAKDLIVSHDPFTFALNPKFTARLQPRKRERAAYQLQVRNIAGALNPDQLIVDTHTIDTGSPIIGDKDNLVECGNGRVIALLIAAKDFPDRITAYKKRLKELAPAYGLPVDDIDKMKVPVLVRRRLNPMTIEQRQAFAEECNGRATAAVSAIEKAKSYADKITPGMLNGLIVLENETIFQAIKAIRNKDFVISFLKAIPANDRGEFVDAKGEISQDGTRLIATAIFVNVFKGERGLAIATKFFESSDPDMLTVFSGITTYGNTLEEVTEKIKEMRKRFAKAKTEDVMLRNETAHGDVSSLDIPMSCGTIPVSPEIKEAIKNASEVG